ncbi:MAG: hypothetical protein E7478_06660 [Ruminococcaceae bacterium]|nr:hypothetical protein [Oscillospiraceae bacterium]
MVKKIMRGIGYAVCILLFVLCVFMIIISALFGASEIVGVFGFNLYLCEESSFAGLENGAAVIVEQCEPYDLDQGSLILYTQAEDAAQAETVGTAEVKSEELLPVLGYMEKAELVDGVYEMEVSDSADNRTKIMGSSLVGKATWSSPVLGKVIRFSMSPWGVCVMAALPCLALIVFSLVKAAAANAPIPEVLPQKKNEEREEVASNMTLGVKADGNAEYSRNSGGKPGSSADSVLFTYGKSRRSPATMKPSAPDTEQPEPAVSRPAPKQSAQGSIPSSIAARRYIDSATAAQKKATAPKPEPKSEEVRVAPQKLDVSAEASEKEQKLAEILKGSTAEMPIVTKKKKSDAFFAQSEAPQIGRGLPKNKARRELIDLEDALATAGAKESKKRAEPAGRKSAAILASKSRSELISDDDDSRDRSRYDVEDILSGLDRRR